MITVDSYRAFCEFLDSACGIVLGPNKEYLVSSRLRSILAEQKVNDLNALLEKVRAGNPSLKQAIVDAMTTNETLWFRDFHPYQYLKQELLDTLYKEAEPRRPRIWSAACSSGQEPYSIAICAAEHAQTKPLKAAKGIEIIATDISSSILDSAKKAEYDTLALNRGMTQDRLQKFFDKTPRDTWALQPAVRSMVQFKQLNLQESYIGLGGKLDAIFCRNVLIYFSQPNKEEIIRKMHGALRPGGFLLLGASESIGPAGQLFQMTQYSGGIAYKAK